MTDQDSNLEIYELVTVGITIFYIFLNTFGQVIFCNFNLQRWDANTTTTRLFLLSHQYTKSVDPTRRFVWCSLPFHRLFCVPSNIVLLHTLRLGCRHEILSIDLLKILTIGCQHWIGQRQRKPDGLWGSFITWMNK